MKYLSIRSRKPTAFSSSASSAIEKIAPEGLSIYQNEGLGIYGPTTALFADLELGGEQGSPFVSGKHANMGALTQKVQRAFEEYPQVQPIVAYVVGLHARLRWTAASSDGAPVDPVWRELVSSIARPRPIGGSTWVSPLSVMDALLWAMGEGWLFISLEKDGNGNDTLACSAVRANCINLAKKEIKINGVWRPITANENFYPITRTLGISDKPISSLIPGMPIFEWMRSVQIADIAIEHSRASAGLLYISDNAKALTVGAKGSTVGGKGLGFLVAEWFSRPSSRPGHPASVSPLVIHGPVHTRPPIEQFIVGRKPVSPELRESKRKELAGLLDLPERRITGEQGKYWNEFVMRKEEVDTYVMPIAEVTANAATALLKPIYESLTGKPLGEQHIFVDPAALLPSEDRFAVASYLWEHGLITDAEFKKMVNAAGSPAPDGTSNVGTPSPNSLSSRDWQRWLQELESSHE